MVDDRKRFGREGESAAVSCLREQGYVILETNFKTKVGEIDIIAREENTIVFVEVRSRSSSKFGNPKESITGGKQKKITKTALIWLKKNKKTGMKARFDVVTVYNTKEKPRLELIRNAFTSPYS
jgi:putative endonuclease